MDVHGNIWSLLVLKFLWTDLLYTSYALEGTEKQAEKSLMTKFTFFSHNTLKSGSIQYGSTCVS